MRTVVYLDVLLIINLILDYLILLCIKLLTGDLTSRWRLFAGAVVAAITSLIIIAPRLNIYLNFLYKILTALLIVSVSFKFFGYKMFIKKVIWFLILNLSLAGAVTLYMVYVNSKNIEVNNFVLYLDISPLTLLFCVMTVYIIIKILVLLFGTPKKEGIYKFEIIFNGTKINTNIFWDTGFRLCDTFTQKPVLMLDVKCLNEEERKKITEYKKGHSEKENEKLRFLFVKTVNGESVIPCTTAQKITDLSHSDGVSVNNFTVAFSENSFTNGYNGVAGNEFMESFNL
ncbi:MAG: sigma-E processing peptidase SpoIIGA [Oscillospiraceae bacterium]